MPRWSIFTIFNRKYTNNSREIITFAKTGELQDDWYDGIDVLKSADLSGKTVALFGMANISWI